MNEIKPKEFAGAAIYRECSMAALIAAVALLVTSCMVGPDYQTPKADVAEQWPPSTAIANRPFSDAETYWWKNFNDPVLNQLVETACSNNLSLQIAGVRILETARPAQPLHWQSVSPAAGHFRRSELFATEQQPVDENSGREFRLLVGSIPVRGNLGN